MKMSRTQKEKLKTYTDASLQLISENSTEESAVTTADDYNANSPEKRKKDAKKPLYLKRI
jgi:hypothetical protein